MESLKILMVTTHFPPYHLGGDAQFVEYLAKELVHRGHEIHVFYSPVSYDLLRSDRKTNAKKENETEVGRHRYTPRAGRLDPLLALSLGLHRKAERDLRSLVSDLKPDVVNWHNSRGFVGRPWAFPGRISLYTTHDYTPVCPRSNLMKPHMHICNDPRWCTVCCVRWGKPPQIWRAGRKRVLRYDKDLRLLPPSEFMAKRFRDDGVPVHEVLRLFVPDLGADFKRESAEGDSILYLGLIEHHKGVRTLLEAFAKSERDQGFKLHLIGEGTIREDLTRRTEALGLANRISIPGFLDRSAVETLRKNAVAQVVPSVWYENAPSVVAEAFSLGIPVVASDIGGLPEMVTRESGSTVFPPGDVNELARILVDLWQTRDSLKEKRRKARIAYETRFTPDIHIKNYLRVISELQ